MRAGKVVVCPVCTTRKYRYPSELKRGYKYCSKKCWYTILPKNQSVCPKRRAILDKARTLRNLQDPEYRKRRSEISKRLYTEGKIKPRYGAENNLWKGGIASTQNIMRHRKEYKDWRKLVYERDDYTCQDCGQRGGELHAHHIKPFAEYPKLRYVVNNGLTLCQPCHSKHHGRYIPSIGQVNKSISV